MKRTLLAVLVLALVATVGCSGLQVKADMTTTMTLNAAQAREVVLADAHGTLSPADARTYLAGPALALKTYYDAATLNGFAYVFGTAKIYATPALYTGLQAVALDAVENAKRVQAITDATAKQWAVLEAQAIINVDNARKAVKS